MSTGPEAPVVGVWVFLYLTLRRAIDEALLLIFPSPFPRHRTFLFHPSCLTDVSQPLEASRSQILRMFFLVTVQESPLSVWLALSEVVLATSDAALLLPRLVALTI
jgi:hypothetical protein